MAELRLVVSLIPPSAGTYLRHRVVIPRRGKPFVQLYHTEEAKQWWAWVDQVNAGRRIGGSVLDLRFIVYVPDYRRRDTDNWGKCICDALTRCGAIKDDSLIYDIHGHKRVDPNQAPRTVIVVTSDQESLL